MGFVLFALNQYKWNYSVGRSRSGLIIILLIQVSWFISYRHNYIPFCLLKFCAKIFLIFLLQNICYLLVLILFRELTFSTLKSLRTLKYQILVWTISLKMSIILNILLTWARKTIFASEITIDPWALLLCPLLYLIWNIQNYYFD